MSSLAVINAGLVLSGDLERPLADADALLAEDGKITWVGPTSQLHPTETATVIDAGGAAVMPGLIDSHFHVVLGDYQPRQKVVDFIESYVHGGVTSMVSAGEIHTPGRPRDAAGVKALAILAQRSFSAHHPLGAKVQGGTVVIEPTIQESDFAELAREGVRLAKFGFGAFARPEDGEPQIRWAQKHGLKVMCHSGGTSIPGSIPITAEMLARLKPDICGHVNGGPTALDEDGLRHLVTKTALYLQLVQAGNLRSALFILGLAREHGALQRVIVGSDTPTGTGVMPLGVLKTVTELASLGGLPPATSVCLATGNNARAFGLNAGLIAPGREADFLLVDAPHGSTRHDVLSAMKYGDIPGVGAVIIDGQLRLLGSRNTPPPKCAPRVVRQGL